MEHASPGELLQEAEIKLARFQNLFSQYNQNIESEISNRDQSGINPNKLRDMPVGLTPGSSLARPVPSSFQGPRQSTRISRRQSEGEAPYAGTASLGHDPHGTGGPWGLQMPHANNPKSAWPGGVQLTSMGPPTAFLNPDDDVRVPGGGGGGGGGGDDAASDLMLQYRVASATAEQLASKVLLLQQQLSTQVGSHIPKYPHKSMHASGICDM